MSRLRLERQRIVREYRINRQIRASEVRIIGTGDDGDSPEAAVLPTQEALAMAEGQGMDLVEVSPNQSPPVCKILDYGRFKFVQAKKAKEARKSQVRTVQREVRLRPRTGDHDVEAKIRKVKSLLGEGAKVKVSVMLRGREHAHPEIAVTVLRRVAEAVAAEAKLELPPAKEQRSFSIVLAPATQPAAPPAQPAAVADAGDSIRSA